MTFVLGCTTRYTYTTPQIAIEILNEGRIGIAAQMIGLAQGAFDLSVPYTYTRSQFHQPIGTFQGMAFSFARAATQIESARLLTYNAARRKEAGLSFVKEAAMAKWWASKVAQEVSGEAIEWMGGLGFTRETGVEKFWRDSKIVSGRFFFSELCSTWFGLMLILACRVRYMKGRRIFSCRRLQSLFRRIIHRKVVCIFIPETLICTLLAYDLGTALHWGYSVLGSQVFL